MSYFAIRKPASLKGVYSDSAQIKKMKKKVTSEKGASYREFKDDEKEEALKWVDVKGVADVKQGPVKDVKEKATNSFEQVILEYVQEGNEVVQIELINGYKFYITTKDIYYRKGSYGLETLFYSRYYDEADREYKYKLEEEKVLKNIDKIGSVLKTKLKFFKDGIKIENYGDLNSEGYEKYSHALGKVYVPNSSVLMIKPYGVWTSPHKSIRITEKKIIDIYNKNK